MFCRNCSARKIAGCSLIFLGVIFLVCFLPFWVWIALLGALLIGIGCYIILSGY